jgi:hypothetical protein
MRAVGPERHILHPDRRRGVERRVEMRKQVAAARYFVFQLVAQLRRVDGDEQQVVLPGEVPCRRFLHLGGGREVDEAVGKVDRRALENAGPFGFRPLRPRRDLVDDPVHDGCIIPRRGGEKAGRPKRTAFLASCRISRRISC